MIWYITKYTQTHTKHPFDYVFRAVVLFIIEDVTYNICDQKFHEFEIRRQNPDVFVLRKTLTEVADHGRLDSEKRLFIGDIEIAVIYFRCGYDPDQYPSEKGTSEQIKQM